MMSQTYDPPAHSTRRKWLRRAIFAVPVVWAGLILAFMRPDAIEARAEIPFEIKWLIYDESDLGALVLRGANADMGRVPGRPDEPKWAEPEDIAARLDHPPADYEARYYLEYPTPALLIFRLGYLFDPAPTRIPPALADAHHYGIAHFIPRNDEERAIWSQLRAAAQIHIVLTVAALVGLMLVLARGYEPGGPRPPFWLAALPGAVFFALNRFDVLPALATALAFASLGRGKMGWSGAWLAVGALLKVYPVLFVPVILRYLGPARGARWLAGFAAVALAGAGISIAVLGWEPTLAPVKVQFSRTLAEISWTFYGKLLPLELAHSKWGRLGILAAAVLAMVAIRPRDLAGVLRRCGVILCVFVILSVFWSPQWILWFLPILVPLAASRRWILWTAVGLDAANYFNFPILFWILWNRLIPEVTEPIGTVLIYVRAVLWFGLAAGLIREEWRASRRSSQGPE
jgi:hypothetical protein